MEINKTTAPLSVGVTISDDQDYLDKLRERADYDGLNDDSEKTNNKFLTISNEGHSYIPSEYYYDDNDNAIIINGELESPEGKTSIWISMPLSDEVLQGILLAGIKKFNKLKTIIEATK